MTCDLIRGCGKDKSLTLFKSSESWIRLVGVCLRRVTEHNKLKAAQMWLWGRRADPVPQERHVWTVHNTAADQKSVLAPKPFRAFWTNRKCFRRGIKIWNMERCDPANEPLQLSSELKMKAWWSFVPLRYKVLTFLLDITLTVWYLSQFGGWNVVLSP